MGKGTLAGTASAYKAKSNAGIKHGPSNKSIVHGGKSAGKPASAPVKKALGALKGPDRGGLR